jgi:hypothetical protein
MPIIAIIIGVMCLDLAFRGTEHQFAAQLGKDFGQGTQFWSWAAAIGVVGALGYVPSLSKVSNPLLALVITVLVVRRGGFFDQIAALIEKPPAASASLPLSAYPAPPPDVIVEGSSGGSSAASTAGTVIGSIAKAFL